MSNPRAEYVPIIDRKPIKLPDGARVAVWVIVNVEEWDINEPMARTVLPAPQGVKVIPDIPNYSWFEYGLRVGFWRIKEVLDRHGIKATVSLNAHICKSYPRIVEACLQSGWEIMGHGYIQRAINLEKDERDVVRRTNQLIKEFTGKAPRGWMGPGLAETFDTPDILAEERIEYICDWVNDDQPYPMKVKKGTLYSIPYTVELNDIPIYVVQNHRSPELYKRARDYFDTVYREGASSARVMAISTHPYISGVPHRIKYLDLALQYIKGHAGVLFMTGSEILDWYKAATIQEARPKGRPRARGQSF
ncbi:MAG: polysaccharide deacetylase family protein [Chloroflexi bacterium]|nr:polysaccharide deacetylase family protein [Chloroflexota bacterium]